MIDAPSPSPYRIPQRCPPDRQVARKATIAERRLLYGLRTDDLAGDPREGFRLPSYVPVLPKEARFTVDKLADLLGHKIQGQVNGWAPNLAVKKIEDYGRYYRLVPKPDTAARWNDDDELARQRVAGVSPLHLRATDAAPEGRLREVVDRELERRGTTIGKVLDRGRLFVADYGALGDERIQKYAVRNRRWLAAPKALYFVGDDDQLHTLGIELPPDRDCPDRRAYGPGDDPWAWSLAKWHAQAADGTLHEGFYHLFETHMVTELVAICAARNLHPDHPVAQLLAPHFEFNLAIDTLARSDMLAPGKAIDQALAAGSAGALNAVRILYNDGWKWSDRAIDKDLAARGTADRTRLPDYPYRDYGLGLHRILREYVEGAMSSFYRSDEDVRGDFELAAWLKETAAHLFGFPDALTTMTALHTTLTEIVFRASVGHAAVNNGQFDTYGYPPYAPGSMLAPPPSRASYGLGEAIVALPRGPAAIAQIGMAWALSEPTHYGLLGIGDVPAFAPELAPASREAVATVRRRLQTFSDELAEDNRTRAVPYLYLDPRNIERSTGT